MQYKVIKQHYADKQYWQGDVRIIDNDHDAGELINMGLIASLDAQKSEKPTAKTPKPRNKAAIEHDNKAE